ncbi:SusC/RagA family TonB-linked outer membrane protein [Bizionia paragorgiae]|uniref:TonB-linked outer membrane protein, SusC/RagA family n=1 Tax=Bizionia paragorgiae TaxID=283786 RepID=A0A1H3ZTX5_BIZPA|nr:SusC/RagA family TonB-linked outer membrane protein [Bizionia paragorgiae]SEA27167.1 TonB-linked outer membrane protein, SusC/RagA family [Bizionia paragorgiae]
MKTKFSGILTLFLAFVVQLTFAQEKSISGTISDENGLPLPGVNIVVKGTNSGTQSDFDGKYALSASTGDVITYSFVGYKDVNKTVGTSNTISFSMEVDVATIDEVVITAMGIKREKRETSYVTESVDSDKLLTVQPQSAASALAGKVAGLQINVQDNGVKPSTQILLRGLRSITQSNSALIVIDGSISTQGAFDQLNPNDIESINTLKGATAAALYGSRAANGALLITTKTGQKGDKFTIGVNSSYTIEQVAYMPDFQTQYGSGWQGAYDPYENTNWGPAFDGVRRRVGPIFNDGSYQSLAYAPIKDNLKDFYNTGGSSNNTVYVSGSDEKNRFYMSFGRLETEGIVPDDTYTRNSLRVNASRKMGKLELGLTSSYTTDKSDLVGQTIGSQDRPLYWFILNTTANIPLSQYKDWRNDKYASPNGWYNAYYQNPYWAIDTNRDTDKSNRLVANMNADWEVTEWLDLTGRIGVNSLNSIGKEWRDAQAYAPNSDYLETAGRPDPVSSFVEDYEAQSLEYSADFLAQSEFELSEKFNLKAILGATTLTQKLRQSAYRANNLSIPGFYDLSNTTGQLAGGLVGGAFVNERVKRTYGLFGDFSLGYDNFLFASFSGRQDYTSTLSSDNNSYFYPSFGLSFLFSDLLNFDALNFGKVTYSNATVYNDLGPYSINETYGQQAGFPYSSTGLNGFVVSGVAVDTNVQKEKIKTDEIGLNLEFFKRRVTLNAAYYQTTTTDLITTATTAPSAGSNSILTNIGSVEGSGVELSLGLVPFRAENDGDFNWDVNVNFTTNENKVVSIQPGLDQIQIGGGATSGLWAVVGEDFPQVRAVGYERDDQGRVIVNANTGNPVVGGLKDLGKTTPDYIVGLTNAVSYKGFTLTGTMDYRTGHVYISQLGDAMEFTGRSAESVSSNRQDFVFPNSVVNVGTANDPVYVANNNIPVTGGRQNFWTNTYNDIKENYVKDATALKLREVSLRYDMPSKYLDNAFISKLSIALIGRNLITWLPEENRFSDPEFNNSAGNGIGLGGYFQSPPTRSFGVNLNLEF